MGYKKIVTDSIHKKIKIENSKIYAIEKNRQPASFLPIFQKLHKNSLKNPKIPEPKLKTRLIHKETPNNSNTFPISYSI